MQFKISKCNVQDIATKGKHETKEPTKKQKKRRKTSNLFAKDNC